MNVMHYNEEKINVLAAIYIWACHGDIFKIFLPLIASVLESLG